MRERFSKKAVRVISTARLKILLLVHLQPINVVVSYAPQGKTNLGVSFALRCFQRLSNPNAATRRYTWQHNRYTGGSSNSVLSY